MSEKYNIYIPRKDNPEDLIKELNEVTDSNFNKWYLKKDPLTEIENTPTIDIPDTFRFSATLSLLPSEEDENLYIAIFEVLKTSRIHSFIYSKGINDICFRAKNLIEPLDNLANAIISIGGFKKVETEEPMENNSSVNFKIGDEDEFLVTLLCAIFNNIAKLEESVEYSNDEEVNNYNNTLVPEYLVIRHILFERGLTHEEIQSLLSLYSNKFGSKEKGKIELKNEGSLKQLISLIPELELYKEAEDKVRTREKKKSLKNISYAIIDKRTGIAYKSSFGNHYDTMTEIIAKYYYDEFSEMEQDEKDDFIMNNFNIIGKNYYENNSYTPEEFDLVRRKDMM